MTRTLNVSTCLPRKSRGCWLACCHLAASIVANVNQCACAETAGAGPNGAIIHYRAEAKTAGTVDKDTHLLIDSGGQYDCGTTDISAHVATCDCPVALYEHARLCRETGSWVDSLHHGHSVLLRLQRAPCTSVSRQRIRSAASHACCRGTSPSTREFLETTRKLSAYRSYTLSLRAAAAKASTTRCLCTAAGPCSLQAHLDSRWTHWLARLCGQMAWTTGTGPAMGRRPCYQPI